jgi:acetolactate synthase-1/2/3 large subunit
MNGAEAIAKILTREGVEYVPCFPQNPIIEGLAVEGIRPIVARQERVAGNIADGMARMSNGRKLAVVLVQQSAGAENAFAGIAHAFTDGSPILFMPGHPGLAKIGSPPEFESIRNYQSVTKFGEMIVSPGQIPERMRQAVTMLRSGRPSPVMLELPQEATAGDFTGELDYTPPSWLRTGPDPDSIADAARILAEAKCPVIIAGQGIMYAGASDLLVDLAELTGIPVVSTLLGKSAFPENHPLSLGPAAYASTEPAMKFLEQADLILGIGTSLSKTHFSPKIPGQKRFIHVSNNVRDLNKEYATEVPILSDAKLFLSVFIDEVAGHYKKKGDDAKKQVETEIHGLKEAWRLKFREKFESNSTPISPYRIIGEFIKAVDPAETVVTHESGGPRDQLSPFYDTTTPRGYLGWGHSTQLGFSLGLAMGAKLVAPEKLVVNFMGDGSIGMTGMDLETAARAEIPILTIVLHNGVFGNYQQYLPLAAERFDIKKMTGNYTELANSLGVHGERVEQPGEVAPALQRAIKRVKDGRPALLEMMSAEESMISGR